MIKENQKLLNILQLVIDAVIIAASFLLAYDLRFDDTWSPLIKHHIISPPIGYMRPWGDYLRMLILIIPCYLVMYRLFGMYDPKRTNGTCRTMGIDQSKCPRRCLLCCGSLPIKRAKYRTIISDHFCRNQFSRRLYLPALRSSYLKTNATLR